MLKVGFVTCVELGLSCMEEIYATAGQLHLAITLKDEKARNKSGRVYLDSFCEERSVPLVKIDHVNDVDVLDAIAQYEIDWLFIVGWSQIAGADTLRAPSQGCLGIHPTLLPVGRGRAPIPWAIIKGLDETGVTLFVLDDGVDTGPIVAQERLPLESGETATSLYRKIGELHKELIRNIWSDLVAGDIVPVPQDHDHATIWPGRCPEDGRITRDMTVAEADRLVRGVTSPYPGAFIEDSGDLIRVWSGWPLADSPVRPGAREFELADGIYVAEDWELEANG